MSEALRAAMAEAGETTDSLAAQVGVDPKTAARWLSRGRIPHPRTRLKVATVLRKDIGDLWPDVLRRRKPTWLREWIEWEREAIALHWFELAYVPGLLQTEPYARATLPSGRWTVEEIDQLVAARIKRHAILTRAAPPQLVAVMDEGALRRQVPGKPEIMREQLGHLAHCAEAEIAQIHVVPSDVGLYVGLAGQFIVAELPDGRRAAHADNQLNAQFVDDPAEVARLAQSWEQVRSLALPANQSLDLIKKAAK
ncbi:helix-turn-helix domain-containing protein [Micromonospora zhanjiangensis]|uniref:Helix-turn-helix domain-containing protein n=1 Tax=Micromonospora zhanjiangensis TaxID=1522057 RepID=A0ABV8KGD6_9ACTN